MVALLGRGLGLGLRVVADQLRVVLVGVAAEESVVPLESPPQRPAVIRPRGGHRLLRREVPLADAVGVVARRLQDLGEEPVLERDVPVRAGKSGGPVGQTRQVIRMMVAAVDDARPRWRAQRGGVHVRVQQAVCGQRVDVRRGDRASIAAEVTEPHVVDDDEQDVRRARLGARRRRPRRCRLGRRASDDAGERSARPILVQCHRISRRFSSRSEPRAAQLLPPAPSCSLAITWSRLKLADFCRCGNSTNVSSICADVGLCRYEHVDVVDIQS